MAVGTVGALAVVAAIPLSSLHCTHYANYFTTLFATLVYYGRVLDLPIVFHGAVVGGWQLPSSPGVVW